MTVGLFCIDASSQILRMGLARAPTTLVRETRFAKGRDRRGPADHSGGRGRRGTRVPGQNGPSVGEARSHQRHGWRRCSAIASGAIVRAMKASAVATTKSKTAAAPTRQAASVSSPPTVAAVSRRTTGRRWRVRTCRAPFPWTPPSLPRFDAILRRDGRRRVPVDFHKLVKIAQGLADGYEVRRTCPGPLSAESPARGSRPTAVLRARPGTLAEVAPRAARRLWSVRRRSSSYIT